jgi:uncharacterized membrane protein
MVAPIFFGAIIWIPTLWLTAYVRGPWLVGAEWVVATFAVVSVLVPSLVSADKPNGKSNALLWALALMPIIAVLGVVTMHLVSRTLWDGQYKDLWKTLANLLITLSLWSCVWFLLSLSLKSEPVQEPSSDESKKND